jgi:hypothetical protein
MFGKKMVEGKARILACEGVTSGNSGTDLHGELWMHYKYIVEVHPAGRSALVNARYDVTRSCKP